MFRRRAFRLTAAIFVALSLLFTQLALAAYVCPGQPDADAMAEMMAAGMPCEGMDASQPMLCHEHSASAAQTVEALKLPAPSLPMIVQVLVRPLVLDETLADAAAAPGDLPPRPPPDPLFLSTLRLRV
jgi:hypothetical protein